MSRVGVVHGPGAAATLPELATAARAGGHQLVILLDADQPDLDRRYLRAVQCIGQTVSFGAGTPREQVAMLELDGVCSFHDGLLEARDRLRTDLSLPRATLLENPWDKAVQRKAFSDAALSPVKHQKVSSRQDFRQAVARVGLPGVLKPCRASGSRGLTFVRDVNDIDREVHVRDSWQGLLYEGLLGGRRAVRQPAAGHVAEYVSVESIVSNGQVEHIAVVDKFHLASLATRVPGRVVTRETGDLYPCRLSEPVRREVEAVTTAGLKALGIRQGVMHSELLTSADEPPALIEVNGRLGGEINRLVGQADLVRAELDLSVGLSLTLRPALADTRAAACMYVPCGDQFRPIHGTGSRRMFADITGVAAVDAVARAGDRPADVGFVLAKLFMTGKSQQELDETIVKAAARIAQAYPDDINQEWFDRSELITPGARPA
jgi:biotin carboxylase